MTTSVAQVMLVKFMSPGDMVIDDLNSRWLIISVVALDKKYYDVVFLHTDVFNQSESMIKTVRLDGSTMYRGITTSV